jgi:hypothetical protein
MELLTIIVVFILMTQVFILYVIFNIEKWLSILCDIEPKEPTEAKVTDPYQKPKQVYSSTAHIIVPKTPTEIQNENFNKLKEGIEYGDIAKG